jgi:hypothetical protein
MKIQCKNNAKTGFTLLEMMAAIFVSILIIGSLYQVFSRVQLMFRSGHNQTKVLERGRAIMDMIVRDLEMMRAADLGPTCENLNVRNFGVEFWQEGTLYVVGSVVFYDLDRTYHVCTNAIPQHAITDKPPGSIYWRTLQSSEYQTFLPPDLRYFDIPSAVDQTGEYPKGNQDGNIQKISEVKDVFWPMFDRFDSNKDGVITLDESKRLLPSEAHYSGDFFFLGYDRNWHLFGYGLYSSKGVRTPNPLVGSLYRYKHGQMEYSDIRSEIEHLKSYAGGAKYQKVSDGVMHLRLRAISAQDPGRAPWSEPIFKGSHVPMYVEVEFGLLEDNLTRELEAKAEEFATASHERYWALMAIIESNLDKVHMFRQLVPIRNARYFGINDDAVNTMDMRVFRSMGLDTSIGQKHIIIIDNSYNMTLDNRLPDVKKALKSTDKIGKDITPYYRAPADFIDTLKIVFQEHAPTPTTTIWLITGSRNIGDVDVRIEKDFNNYGVRVNTIGIARSQENLDPKLKIIAEKNRGTYTYIMPDLSIKR